MLHAAAEWFVPCIVSAIKGLSMAAVQPHRHLCAYLQSCCSDQQCKAAATLQHQVRLSFEVEDVWCVEVAGCIDMAMAGRAHDQVPKPCTPCGNTPGRLLPLMLHRVVSASSAVLVSLPTISQPMLAKRCISAAHTGCIA